MPYIKADSDKEQKMFDYLEKLRQSGDTNMYGASPYLQHAFGLESDKAREVLSKWMRLHDDPARRLEKPVHKVHPHRLQTRFVSSK
jgi:hypothetical protein